MTDDDIGKRNGERDRVLMELCPPQRCVGASQLTGVKEESRHSQERNGMKTGVFA